MNIVERIEKLLLSRGVKPRSIRSSLAKTCGISHQAVSQWFTGETGSIKNENLAAIAEKYGSTVDWLLTERGAMTPRPVGADKESNVISADFSTRNHEMIDIPRLNLAGSMGPGLAQPEEYVDVIERMRVSTGWLRRNVNASSPSNLAVITGYGDSMEGTFNDGDLLLVDRGITDIKIDAVYVLSLKGELYIKRLQRRPDGVLLMLSDNAKYKPYEILNGELEQFQVLGRVLLAWNAKRL